jgi:hypothetical protein
MNKTFLMIALSSLVLVPGTTSAQDLDLDGGATKKKRKEFKVKIDQEVKEVTKGWYAKSTIGGAAYVMSLNGVVYPGAVLGMGVGQDFYDQQNFSMAWEVNFLQGVHNAIYYEQQAANGCAQLGTCVQGDLRTFSLVGSAEASWYLAKRFGFGVRAGAGIMAVPLLMDREYYLTDVVGEWSGIESAVHSSPHPLGMGGLTFEYYTKLAHFSVGLDVDATYALGFDLGVSGNGYLKYTF